MFDIFVRLMLILLLQYYYLPSLGKEKSQRHGLQMLYHQDSKEKCNRGMLRLTWLSLFLRFPAELNIPDGRCWFELLL